MRPPSCVNWPLPLPGAAVSTVAGRSGTCSRLGNVRNRSWLWHRVGLSHGILGRSARRKTNDRPARGRRWLAGRCQSVGRHAGLASRTRECVPTGAGRKQFAGARCSSRPSAASNERPRLAETPASPRPPVPCRLLTIGKTRAGKGAVPSRLAGCRSLARRVARHPSAR
jgi:hypothetical protein